MRQLVPGGTSKSYGLHVARLAGLPAEVLTEAAHVLQYLERQESQPAALPLPAVNGTRPPGVAQATAVLAQQLLGLDICQITPLQALSLLHDLQQQARTLVGIARSLPNGTHSAARSDHVQPHRGWEVIERPTSVLKELLDNALDAGSTRIDIELVNGGRRLIQVTDNGCGMSPRMPRWRCSGLRPARFVLSTTCPLATLGFRGEALPSIAAVAEVEMVTRPAEQTEGVLVRSHTSGAPQVHAIGCPVGTRVRVQRLFSHVPVRLRALKSVAREVQLMQELVAHYALAHPQVTLHMQHEGRRLLFAPATTDLRQRLAVIFGQELAAQMLPVSWQSLDLGIQGAVSPPSINRATRQRQYCWVNGRPVRSPLVSAALERAYGALLPPGRHPVAALGITLSPTLLDVNIHPAKPK